MVGLCLCVWSKWPNRHVHWICTLVRMYVFHGKKREGFRELHTKMGNLKWCSLFRLMCPALNTKPEEENSKKKLIFVTVNMSVSCKLCANFHKEKTLVVVWGKILALIIPSFKMLPPPKNLSRHSFVGPDLTSFNLQQK